MSRPVVKAIKVEEPCAGPLSLLSPLERGFVKGLKRKERDRVSAMLTQMAKKAAHSTPIRLRVLQSNLPSDLKQTIFRDIVGQQGSCKYLAWVDKILSLPLGKLSLGFAHPEGMKGVLRDAKRTMDEVVSGHEELKLEVLKLICQERASGKSGGYAMGIEGAPGTGKTHFVRNALSAAVGRPFVSIQLGGACDASYLLGSLYTYEGSKEGRLAAALTEAGCMNPVLYFDEVDKISRTEKGKELTDVLIHLIDPTSNTQMRDRFFHGLDLDFSQCTFVFSYNDPNEVSEILLDRIKRFQVRTPTSQEREDIVRRHLVPRVQTKMKSDLELSDEAVRLVANAEEGVGMRGAEKLLHDVMASAQVSLVCDASFLNWKDAPVLKESRSVTGSFVSRLLASRASPAPLPTMMYT